MTLHASEDVEQGEHSFTAGGGAHLTSHYENQYDGFSENRIHLLQDPAIPPLGIYPNDTPSYNKDNCTTIFISAFLVIARN